MLDADRIFTGMLRRLPGLTTGTDLGIYFGDPFPGAYLIFPCPFLWSFLDFHELYIWINAHPQP